MNLADLVDVELQLVRDQDANRADLRARDRRIGLAIRAGERKGERRAVLRDWVRAVQKETGQDSDGERTMRAFHAGGWLLTLIGLTSGAGTAATVLAYDGTRPVNVVHFLAVFVGLQLLLLSLFLLSSSIWRLRQSLPGWSGFYGLLRMLFDALAGLFERRLSAERRATIRAARGRLRATQIVYGTVERWLLVSLAQRFGLAFNLGALATCLYLVAFSDLAFAWQTTLSVTPEGFHRVVQVIGAPWSWVYPDGVPTLDMVRASRYFRLDGTFAHASSPEELGQWWRFLVLSLLVFGLLPRLGLSIYSGSKLRRAVDALRLDHADVASLLDRLAAPLVRTQAPLPEAAGVDAPAPSPPAATSSPPETDAAVVIVWGDVPIQAGPAGDLVADRFGWRVGRVEAAGAGEAAQDAAAIAAVAGGERVPVVVLAEAFEAPTREARTFLARLRTAVGADRPIVVSLVDSDGPGRWSVPEADDMNVWRKHVAQLGDPYLRVEALVE